MGGEKPPTDSAPPPGAGSPPHGRGKAAGAPVGRLAVGITPAWAGKRSTPPHGGWCRHNHPRMGGEKMPFALVTAPESGSPPHGRGKVLCSVFGVLPHRITPAWAGKSSSTRTRLPIRWDHPRMGGEKPPHWWRSSITEDHPRMGGEKPLSNVVCSTFSGSPPHGRGKVSFCHAAGFGLWITPAWAGKSGHCHRGTG